MVEIDDTLQEHVDSAIEQVKEALVEWLDVSDGGDFAVYGREKDVPCLSNDLDYSGRIHEIVDGSVPIYTHEIDTIWYLHKNELEEAYENAGVGENPLENNGMAAIYFYIQEKVGEWYHNNAEQVCNRWVAEKTKEEE
jgi:hypothetical protein